MCQRIEGFIYGFYDFWVYTPPIRYMYFLKQDTRARARMVYIFFVKTVKTVKKSLEALKINDLKIYGVAHDTVKNRLTP